MNYDEARDQILGVFKAAWDTTEYAAIYPDVPDEVPQGEEGEAWARASVIHANGHQASLAGENGARRWQRDGIVTIQIFARVGDGLTKAYELAQLVSDAFQDAKNLGVWFRNVRIKEVGNSGAFEQINVLANFTYDQVR